MIPQAYSAKSITDSILGFFQFIRGYGFNVGLDQTHEALLIGQTTLLADKVQFKIALTALCCTSKEEQGIFLQLFTNYWDTNPLDLSEMTYKTTRLGQVQKTNTSPGHARPGQIQ